jgi:hypothetical protein
MVMGRLRPLIHVSAGLGGDSPADGEADRPDWVAGMQAVSDATAAAVVLIVSIGVVISYPTFMYPPLRSAGTRFFRALVWPLRAARQALRDLRSRPVGRRMLGQEVHELAQFAEAKARELAEATGRMWLETQLYIHKPQHAIRDADRQHEALTSRLHQLTAATYGQPVQQDEWFQRHEATFRPPPRERWWEIDLWFTWAVWKMLAVIFIAAYSLPRRRVPSYRVRSRKRLAALREEWLALLEHQADLLDLMLKLPELTRTYDRLESAKEVKREQRATEEEQLRPLKTAEIALQSAKAHIRVLQIRPQHTPTKGSAVLTLEPALREWKARVEQIERARNDHTTPEELIRDIHALERDMAMAGIHAARVIWIERRAQQIWMLHRRLKKTYRDLRLPDSELEAITTTVRKAIPPLWASARWDELTAVLDRALNNIQNYERLVLSCVWQLHAGTFQQLVERVFRPETADWTPELRINPQAGESIRRAATAASAKQSPFVERVLEHAAKSNSRLAERS